MYQSRDPQALETCPYNTSHRIIRARMATHIVKCRKAHNGESSMTVCIFNANHSIPDTEINYHLENCADRFNFDKHIIVTAETDSKRFPIENKVIENEETWDNENCPSYKPGDYCAQKPVLRQAKVEPASVRKNFRTEERQRMQKIKDTDPSKSDTPSMSADSRSQNKFRSTPLANTTTNINESYTYEDIQRIVRESIPKAIIANPNFNSTIVRPNDNTDTIESSASSSTTEEPKGAGAAGFTPPCESNTAEGLDNNGFTIQKSKKKIGRGRGRGVPRN